jgi:hypothetical protein
MEHFAIEGQWWLPATPDRRVPGTLTFDGEGLELVLVEPLREFVMPTDQVVGVTAPEWTVEAILHGRTRDRRDFTLLDCGGMNLVGPFHEGQEVYRPDMALDGCHTKQDSFLEVRCGFDYLDDWANVPSVQSGGDDYETVEVRVKSMDLAQAEIPGATCRLVAGVAGTSGHRRVEFSRWTAFAIRPAAPLSAQDLISEFVRPLQDLLVFTLGRPVRLTSLRLLPIDLPDPRVGNSDAFFAAVQTPASPSRTFGDIDNYSAPTILSMRTSPIGLDKLLPRWFDLWLERRDVFTLLLAPLYAPFMFGEHGFASTFQSAELLHDSVLPTSDLAKAAHKERVKAAVEAMEGAGVEQETIDWATKVLRSRNDKPLGRRIEDLIAATGPVGEAVLEADPSIGSNSASARAGVSHGGAKKALEPIERYWYGQVLRWVVRAHLLATLLDDPQAAQGVVVQCASFRRATDEVRQSVARRA